MIFPFGQPLRTVHQIDRRPKRVFVLGVYASAIHARWIGPDGQELVKALAVASEPCIFWRGDPSEARSVIGQITVPPGAGTLEPADDRFNGASGRALDDYILSPLGVTRRNAWLCDLVPHSCTNSGQKKAIDEHYMKFAREFNLPEPSIPQVPKELTDESRRRAIIQELRESKARLLILLGDEPIKWFLRFCTECPKRLRSFKQYGVLNPFVIAGQKIEVLPLVHPRQAARLGTASDEWHEKHRVWLTDVAPKLRAR